MAIEVKCPNGHRIKAPEKYAGKKVKCPKCKVVILVPATVRPELVEEIEIVEPEAAPDPLGIDSFATDGFNSDPFADAANFDASADPLSNPLGDLSGDPLGASMGDPLGVPGGDPLGAPVVGGAYAAPVAQPQQPAKKSGSSKNLLLIIGGVGGGVLFLILAVVAFLFLFPGGDGGGGDPNEFAESKALRAEAREMFSGEEFGGSLTEEKLEDSIKQSREVFPNYMFLPIAREKALSRGEESPIAKELTEQLLTITNFESIRDKYEKDGRSDEFIFQLLAVSYRGFIKNYDGTTDKDKTWEKIAAVENGVFGEHSLVKITDEPKWKKVRLQADAEMTLQKFSRYWLRQEAGSDFLPPTFDESGDKLCWRSTIFGTDKPQPFPGMFRVHGLPDSQTSWRMIESVDSIAGSKEQVQQGAIPDGADFTIFCVLCGAEYAVECESTEPLRLDPAKDASQFGTPLIETGYPALTASGRPVIIPADLPADELAKLFNMNDGGPSEEELGSQVLPFVDFEPKNDQEKMIIAFIYKRVVMEYRPL